MPIFEEKTWKAVYSVTIKNRKMFEVVAERLEGMKAQMETGFYTHELKARTKLGAFWEGWKLLPYLRSIFLSSVDFKLKEVAKKT